MTPQQRAVVTGGAGFLGSRVIARLLEGDWDVTAIDNLTRGTKGLIERFAGHARFRLVEADIAGDRIADVIRTASPNVVYHLAAHHFIPYCTAHPVETLRVNVVGTQRILDAIGAVAACRRLVFISTGDVYAPAMEPHSESSTKGAGNIYGLSKLVGEQLLDLARRARPDIRFLVARMFNLYGPGETNAHVVPDILDEIARGPVLRLGNIDAIRDYLYVDDAAEALCRLAVYDGAESVFNVGSGCGRSVRDLIAVIERALQIRLTVETDPAKLRAVDRPRLVADASRAARELGWRALTSIDEGIVRTLASRRSR